MAASIKFALTTTIPPVNANKALTLSKLVNRIRTKNDLLFEVGFNVDARGV